MSTFLLTGWHVSWLACLLLAPDARVVSVCKADDLVSSVNSESLNLVKAFRGLDQSYQCRGMSSRLASTAGSVFADGYAKGDSPEHRQHGLAPDSVVVGCGETEHHCKACSCNCGHGTEPNVSLSAGFAGGTTPLHGSGAGCAATVGLPLHPRCNDCRATIGIPLHPHAFACEDGDCHDCETPAHECRSFRAECQSDDVYANQVCHDCFVVEEYRDGRLTKAVVPCDRCKAADSSQPQQH